MDLFSDHYYNRFSSTCKAWNMKRREFEGEALKEKHKKTYNYFFCVYK